MYGRQIQADQNAQEMQIKKELAAQNKKENTFKNQVEQAALRMASGQGTPQDEQLLKAHDALHPHYAFDPATQSLMQMPGSYQALGSGASQVVPAASGGYPSPVSPQGWEDVTGQINGNPGMNLPVGDNPRQQATINDALSRKKIDKAYDPYNEGQAAAAGYADRLYADGPVIDKNQDVGTDPLQRGMSKIPYVGNYLTSSKYQQLSNAEADFTRAVLRKESGALISPEEGDEATIRYFPRPGDSPDVLKQKATNREIAIKSMHRAAGTSYQPPQPRTTQAPQGKIPQGAIEMLRANPSLANKFEEKYGPGSVQQVLGQ